MTNHTTTESDTHDNYSGILTKQQKNGLAIKIEMVFHIALQICRLQSPKTPGQCTFLTHVAFLKAKC